MSRDHVSSGLALRIFTNLALLKQATPQGKFALMSMSTDGKKKLSCGVPCNPYPIVRLGEYKDVSKSFHFQQTCNFILNPIYVAQSVVGSDHLNMLNRMTKAYRQIL